MYCILLSVPLELNIQNNCQPHVGSLHCNHISFALIHGAIRMILMALCNTAISPWLMALQLSLPFTKPSNISKFHQCCHILHSLCHRSWRYVVWTPCWGWPSGGCTWRSREGCSSADACTRGYAWPAHQTRRWDRYPRQTPSWCKQPASSCSPAMKQDSQSLVVQWNLSVTTTFMITFIACDLFSNVFQWRLKVPIYSCQTFLPSGAHLGGPWPPRWAPEGREVSH